MKASQPRRAPRRRVDGLLLLDKPTGLSSNAALQRARNLFNAAKAGHTGTLDPLASGLLPLCFGEATKFAQYLLDANKHYLATVQFGATTTTGDAEGEVLVTSAALPTEAAIRAALPALTGDLLQLPHAYSALKFQGRNYYEYAREGVAIPRTPRPITVHALQLVAWESPRAVLAVECSKGTYVRVLAEDLGQRLGCGAHLAALRRTRTGGFALADAVSLEALEALPPGQRDECLRPVSTLLRDLPALACPPNEAARFRQGAAIPAPGQSDGACAVFCDADLLGVALVTAGVAAPRRVSAALADDEQRG